MTYQESDLKTEVLVITNPDTKVTVMPIETNLAFWENQNLMLADKPQLQVRIQRMTLEKALKLPEFDPTYIAGVSGSVIDKQIKQSEKALSEKDEEIAKLKAQLEKATSKK